MPDRFSKFVHDENIKTFRKKIEAETDPVRLTTLKTLLKEEQARAADDTASPPAKGSGSSLTD